MLEALVFDEIFTYGIGVTRGTHLAIL
jgi:hypothetical protein